MHQLHNPSPVQRLLMQILLSSGLFSVTCTKHAQP
jgi:hypothetical protein